MPKEPKSKKSKKSKRSTSPSGRSRGGGNSASSVGSGGSSSAAPSLPSSGYLLTCDPPTKQFVKHMNETKSVDKKFILEDLDATHLLIDGRARGEIMRKVEEWMDANVFSNVERVGENLET